MTKQLVFCLLALNASAAFAQDPFADEVVDFDSGSNPAAGFTNPNTVLGEPTRVTAGNAFGGAGPVTPFNGAASPEEVFSLGEGGSITVRFDEPVTNDPRNPFGIDLLVFGNAILFGADFPVVETSTFTGLFSEGGEVAISSDGISFTPVSGDADGLFPTAGFTEFASTNLSDFTLPVDPEFDPIGLTPGEVFEGFNGSGGGLGIDIGAAGFSEISYVLVTNPVGSGVTPEIDGFSDVRAVPEPSTLAIAAAGFGLLVRGRRRG